MNPHLKHSSLCPPLVKSDNPRLCSFSSFPHTLYSYRQVFNERYGVQCYLQWALSAVTFSHNIYLNKKKKRRLGMVYTVYNILSKIKFWISLWKRFPTKFTFFELDLCTTYELQLPQYLFGKVIFGQATLSHLNQVGKKGERSWWRWAASVTADTCAYKKKKQKIVGHSRCSSELTRTCWTLNQGSDSFGCHPLSNHSA